MKFAIALGLFCCLGLFVKPIAAESVYAEYGRFPFMALIRRRCFGWYITEQTACTGVILKPKWVLTSRHCIENKSGFGKTFVVQAGIVIDDPAYGFETRPMGTFAKVVDTKLEDNIALLKLDSKLYSNKHGSAVRNIHLEKEEKAIATDDKLYVVGWVVPPCGFDCMFKNIALKYDEFKASPEKCYAPIGVRNDKDACYRNGVLKEGKCDVLSEGPLIRLTPPAKTGDPEKWELVGFTVRPGRPDCQSPNAVYTLLTHKLNKDLYDKIKTIIAG